jgi:UV DNA damage endonuclease
MNSQILPLATHPVSGYRLSDLDRGGVAGDLFLTAGARARELDIRLSFHPDQFVVLNSIRDDVVTASLLELEYQASVAELVGADVIVLHGGGAAGGREQALTRLAHAVDRLSPAARSRLALENDDRQFTPASLLPVCRSLGIPLVYDVHHHRCLPDELSVAEATDLMVASWGPREPYAHISSPREGWDARDRRPHADFLEQGDLPEEWSTLRMTVDVEAKEKDRAIVQLMRSLASESKPKAERSS